MTFLKWLSGMISSCSKMIFPGINDEQFRIFSNMPRFDIVDAKTANLQSENHVLRTGDKCIMIKNGNPLPGDYFFHDGWIYVKQDSDSKEEGFSKEKGWRVVNIELMNKTLTPQEKLIYLIDQFALNHCSSSSLVPINNLGTEIHNVVRVNSDENPPEVNQEDNKEERARIYIKSNSSCSKDSNIKEKNSVFISYREEDVEKLKGHCILVKGKTQLGKTGFMLTQSLRLIPRGINSLIIVRNNTGDLHQTSCRAEVLIEKLKASLPPELVNLCNIRIMNGKNADDNMVDDMINGKRASIFLMIANKCNLTKFISKVEKLDKPAKSGSSNLRFCLFIDEADILDSSYSNTARCVKNLKSRAFCTFAVTATCMDNIADEYQLLKFENMIFLEPSPSYKAHEWLQHMTMPEGAKYSSESKHCILNNVPGITQVYDTIINQGPHYDEWKIMWHPRICLVNVGDSIHSQYKHIQWLREHYKNSICTIQYTSDKSPDPKNKTGFIPGFTLASSRLPRSSIEISDKIKSKWLPEENSHWIKGTGIQDILNYLRTHGGTELFPIIIIIAGGLADRCISYVSGDCSSMEHHWHISDQILVFADTTSQVDIIQRSGRSTGNFKDNVPLRIWCSDNTFKILRHSYWAQEELLERAKKLCQETDKTMKEIIENLQLSREKWAGCKHKLTICHKLKPKLTKGDDKGWPLEMHNFNFDDLTASAIDILNTQESIPERSAKMGLMRKIVTSKIRKGTIGERIIDAVKEAYKSLKRTKGDWIARQEIIEWIETNADGFSLEGKTLYNISGQLRDFYSKKSTDCADPDSEGILIKKNDNSKNAIYYLRYNS